MREFIFLLLIPGTPLTKSTEQADNAKVISLPVFEGEVDRPYRVIGEIKDNLRKPFAFLPDPTKVSIFTEIWERGKKMGADAVIHARFGETRRTLFNHGKTPISGTEIKYINLPN